MQLLSEQEIVLRIVISWKLLYHKVLRSRKNAFEEPDSSIRWTKIVKISHRWAKKSKMPKIIHFSANSFELFHQILWKFSVLINPWSLCQITSKWSSHQKMVLRIEISWKLWKFDFSTSSGVEFHKHRMNNTDLSYQLNNFYCFLTNQKLKEKICPSQNYIYNPSFLSKLSHMHWISKIVQQIYRTSLWFMLLETKSAKQ